MVGNQGPAPHQYYCSYLEGYGYKFPEGVNGANVLKCDFFDANQFE